jgi:hypothetical protein
MILFTILLCILLGLAVSTFIGGLAFLIVYGDIIIFVLIVVWIIKKIVKKKKG